MSNLQRSPLGKLLSWVLLLVFTFAGVQLGLLAACSIPLTREDWQSTPAFSSMLQERRSQLSEYFINWLVLQDSGYAYLSYMEQQQIADAVQEAQADFDAQATAFRFQIRSQDGSQVFLSNLEEGESISQAVKTVSYGVLVPVALAEQASRLQWQGTSPLGNELFLYGVESGQGGLDALTEECAILVYGVHPTPPNNLSDEFSALYRQYAAAERRLAPFTVSAAACGILSLICLGYALWSAGHRAGQEGVVLSWQDRIFLEIHLLLAFILIYFLVLSGLYAVEALPPLLNSYFSALANSSVITETRLVTCTISLLATLAAGTAALLLRTIAVRCKARALAQTTLLCRVVGWMVRTIRDFILNLPLTWRVVVGFLLYFFLNLILFSNGQYNELFTGLWLLLNLAVLLMLAWWTAHFRRLRKGSQAIASGNLNHQIETQRMPWDLRRYAEDLNNISAGISHAVEDQMKSERFKAELITNVSHDLKTPLTSIINYVNLLRSTRQDDPKALEYIEVLDRKSQRLKKLTEDLVEASKASTGALSVNREKISMGRLLDQALGEWTEKLEERKLTVVSSIPEGETWVYADGRHLWRVIDNLLSNCAKYAMEGTRIYLDLTRGSGQVTLSVKNISREALNVPAERLMERFVRGDESRTTEGSGLGLSIARSLTELQGGAFSLAVDGDLFKATVTLPQAS